MKIKTVVVSNYPVLKVGLKKVLGPDFMIVACYSNISELLSANSQVELAILDEETSSDLHVLRSRRPNLTILKLSLEDNTGCLYESLGGGSRAVLLRVGQSLTGKLSAIQHSNLNTR